MQMRKQTPGPRVPAVMGGVVGRLLAMAGMEQRAWSSGNSARKPGISQILLSAFLSGSEEAAEAQPAVCRA